jgi:glucosamine--fructose-6-phosphate aminotransferase (isomerizing)
MTSLMASEASSVPDIIAAQLKANQPLLDELIKKLRQTKPKFVVMVGRGSSDHAAVFGKYLIEVELGLPVSYAAPSVTTVYNKSLCLQDGVAVVISQSGKSPDLIAQTQSIRKSGAYCIALINDETSPIAEHVDLVIPLRAGPELAVAATKNYICTL